MLQTIQDWIISNGFNFVKGLVAALIILAVGKVIIDLVMRLVTAQVRRLDKFSELLKSFLIGTMRKILWILVLLTAMAKLGVPVIPFITGLGIAGFILGFAFQDSLSNLAAGLMILMNDPFKAGDFVEVGGISGSVKEMNLMATTLATPDNRQITIPNSKIWGNPITNFTAYETRRIEIKASVSYKADVGRACEVIRGVVTSNSQVLADPAPQIELLEMGNSALVIVVRPWTKTSDYWGAYFALNRDIKNALDAAGIEIPFPQMDLHIKEMPKAG